jgi:hypothetical protein
MERSKWIDRKFSFDYPVGWLHNIAERLLGTPVRLHALVASVNEVLAARAEPGAWSIKEHIGHLLDLEELHETRLKELKEKKTQLSAADMSNTKTIQSNHNSMSLQRLISDFSQERKRFVELLFSLSDDTHNHAAMHPRLKKRMRPIDVAYFTAEHDDHHLATIRQIITKLQPG